MLDILVVILYVIAVMIFVVSIASMIMTSVQAWKGKARVYSGWGDLIGTFFLGFFSTWIAVWSLFVLFVPDNRGISMNPWAIPLKSVAFLVFIGCQLTHWYNWRKTVTLNLDLEKIPLIIVFLGRIGLAIVIPWLALSALGGGSSKNKESVGDSIVGATVRLAMIAGLWKLTNRLVKGIVKDNNGYSYGGKNYK